MTDKETLDAIQEYVDTIPAGPWDRKINIIKALLKSGTVLDTNPLDTFSLENSTLTSSELDQNPDTPSVFTITYKYLSSDGINRYNLTRDQDDVLTCTCPGFHYRDTCRHVKEYAVIYLPGAAH
jgi:hypothetical protein